MSEILSQNQINSLLGSAAVGQGPAAPPDDDSAGAGAAAGGRDYGTLTKAFDLFDEQAATVVSTVLNRDISFTIHQCDKTDRAVIENNPSHEVLLVTGPFTAGLPKPLYCIILKKDVAMLSDLMMMGDGSASYTEDHKDAIAELFSQIMGAYSTSLGEKLGEPVNAGVVTAENCDYARLPFSIDTSDMAILNLSVAQVQPTQILFIVPAELATTLTMKMKNAAQAAPQGEGRTVGLNSSELDDLSKVSLPDGEQTFSEVPIASAGTMKTTAQKENVDMLLDVELDVSIELGRTNLSIKRVLEMGPGSIVELDRMAGEPVDLLVNNKVVAKGEVVVVDENFGIRIVSLVSPEERIRSLR
jgi:flagellar motor switch protein FliN